MLPELAGVLSPVARSWLSEQGATFKPTTLDRDALAGELTAAGQNPWPSLLDLEERLGGLAVPLRADDRDLWCGVRWSLRLARRKRRALRLGWVVWGVPRVRVGGFSPIVWLMAEDGEVVEVDDLGESYYASSSGEKRIEQLAHDDLVGGLTRGGYAHVDGFVGERIAAALGLVAVSAPSDAWQRWWASDGFITGESDEGLVVVEVRAPSDYGARDLVAHTYVHARSQAVRDAALAAGG